MTQQRHKLDGDNTHRRMQETARELVTARLGAASLARFPGTVPAQMSAAYLIQDAAIELWPDRLGGWKVGRIPSAVEPEFGCDRLAGPIFADTLIFSADDNTPAMAIYADGFAAVEAEFVAVIRSDCPAGKMTWSRDEAAAAIDDLRIGLEIASSPLSTINDLGPAVTAADFGNNAGLIVGAAIPDWRSRDPDSLTCETFVDDVSVGTGSAAGLTGGIVRSVQFILELAASRGRPLKAGSAIATGQTTGIHEVSVGQQVRIAFDNIGDVACRLVAAAAR